MNCKRLLKTFAIFAFCTAFAFALCSCTSRNVAEQNVQESGTKQEVDTSESEIKPAEKTKPAEEAKPAEETRPAEETKPEYSKHDVIPEHFSYAMTVQINPLVELFFDKDDMVVGISYLNQDAFDAYKKLDILGTDISTSMNLLITEAINQGFVKKDATVEIEMSQVSDEVSEIDTTVLIKAQAVANQVVTEKLADSTVHVDIVVSDEVTEKTGALEPVICLDCDGTGNNCKECSGTGIVNCKRCNNGIESCGTCRGTAIINCHGCHGAGIDDHGGTCNRCGGNGKQSCDACHGQGTFTCSWCKGELKHVCPECWGEGTCNTCGGDGYR